MRTLPGRWSRATGGQEAEDPVANLRLARASADDDTGNGTMTAPEVSVVVPTRNRLPLLAQTLHTVLAQQGVDLEVVVVDDASHDGTARWLDDHPDPRVRSVRLDTPAGVAGARNAGIDAARGAWVGFVDDDDLWLPGKLAGQLGAARAAGASWALSGAVVFSEGPRLLHVAPPPADLVGRLPWRNTVPGGGSNVVMSREALEKVGGFDPSISIVADWDMWIRLLDTGPPAVLDRPLVAYRVHADNMSRDVARMLRGIEVIETRYRYLREDEGVDWEIVFSWLGRNALRANARWTAARLAARAMAAGHPGASRRLVRALAPVPVRDPVPAHVLRTGWLDRVRPRRVLPWPDRSDRWLTDVLQVRP